jgi:hypothetical protein
LANDLTGSNQNAIFLSCIPHTIFCTRRKTTFIEKIKKIIIIIYTFKEQLLHETACRTSYKSGPVELKHAYTFVLLHLPYIAVITLK